MAEDYADPAICVILQKPISGLPKHKKHTSKSAKLCYFYRHNKCTNSLTLFLNNET